jgi:hypothetical protein
MENPFSERMAVLPDIELFRVLQQEKEYEPLAVEAAKNEINTRKLTDEEKKAVFDKLIDEEQKKEEKRLVIDDAIGKLSELIKNLFIPVPTSTKSPALYINILAILVLAKAIYSLGFEVYFGFSFGFDLFGLPTIATDLFLIIVALSLFSKKKFGWSMLCFIAILNFFMSSQVLYTAWFVDYSDPEGFNTTTGFLYYMAILLVPLIIVFYLNKQNVLQLFRISRKFQRNTLIASISISSSLFLYWVNS